MTQAERDAMRGFITTAIAHDVAKAVAALNVESLRADFASLKEVVASIPAGPPGEKGEPGPAGVDGKDGTSGPAGEPGTKGMDGKDGRDGRDGKDGIASRDELRAEVDKAVTERVEAEVQKRIAEAFDAMPKVEYKGVWKEGEAYDAGNFVTWAGSLWHCDKATSSKPGVADEWTLAVKRGRDGRSA